MVEGGHTTDWEGGVHGKLSAEIATLWDVSVDTVVEQVLERLDRERVQLITQRAQARAVHRVWRQQKVSRVPSYWDPW